MTLIIAHRGASGYKPEMTIPAYELALKQNVDGFETDVRLTKDRISRNSRQKNWQSSKSESDCFQINFETTPGVRFL